MCTKPNLMMTFEINKNNIHLVPRLEELNFKVSKDYKTAYKYVSSSSRSIELERWKDWKDMKVIELGCGGCIECRLQYSKDWASRCVLEASNYSCNYFITLTYNEDNVSLGCFGNMTIDKDDVTNFIHSVRDKFRYNLKHVGIRYFGCQEYGELRNRPHAHILLFNCPIPDLTIDIKTDDGQIIHKVNKVDGSYYLWSQFIKDCWPKGNIIIADVNFNTSAYVSRYILKKQKGENSKIYTESLGIEPPYLFMSRHPGIGMNYVYSNIDSLKEDPHLYIHRINKDCLITSLPRAFLKYIKLNDEEFYSQYIDNCKDKILASRSIIDSVDTVNHQRYIKESLDLKRFTAFKRDFE